MNKNLKRIISAILVLILLIPSAVFADDNAISFQETVDNGSASISYSEKIATITLNPDSKYMLSGISLKDSEGKAVSLTEEENGLVYTAALEDEKTYSLDYSFRRAIVQTSVKQISVKPGETKQLYAWLSYSDDDIKSRPNVFDKDVVFTSSNPEVASVDESGKITGLTKGYSVVTASAKQGSGVNARCYVLVEDGTEEKIGQITVFARFRPIDLLSIDVGHSFIVFKSYKDGVRVGDLEKYFECFKLTDDYYKAVDNYDGTGYDPVTFYYVTNGKKAKDNNEEVRAEYANKLAPQIERVGDMIVDKGQIVSFGCTTHEGTTLSAMPTVVTGDVTEMLERNYLTLDDLKSHPLKTIVGAAKFSTELLYDFSIGYNPINGTDEGGGVCVNEEINRQAYRYDTTHNVTIAIDITQAQFDAMLEYFSYDNCFNVLGRNCTEVASSAWNIVTASRPELNMDPRVGLILKTSAAPAVFQLRMIETGLKLYNDDSITVKINHPAFKADVNSGNYAG